MKYSGVALQKALFNKLNDAVFIDINGTPTKLPVGSHITEGLFAAGPFIVIGEDSGQPYSDAGNYGQLRSAAITVWARGPQGRNMTKLATQEIIALIDNTHDDNTSPLSVEGFEVLSVEWVNDDSPPVEDKDSNYRTTINFDFSMKQAGV